MKPQSQIALVILSLILAYGRQVSAAEVQADLDPKNAQQVLETILPPGLEPELRTLFNVESIDQLTPQQQNALLKIIKIGAAQFKTDGIHFM